MLVIEGVLYAAVEDPNTHHRQQLQDKPEVSANRIRRTWQWQKTYVVCRIRMIVDPAEERRRRILADHLRNEVTPARVLVHERRNIVDETSDDDQRALRGLLLDCTQVISMGKDASTYMRDTHSSPSR